MKKSWIAALTVLFTLSVLCGCARATYLNITFNGEKTDKLVLFEGQNVQLGTDTDAGNVLFTSENADIAETEKDGYVRAKSVGETVVRASGGGLADEVKITVTNYIAVESIILKENYTIKRGCGKSLRAVFLPENSSDKNVECYFLPDDNKVSYENQTITVAADAVAGTVYEGTAVNIRAGVTETFTVTVSAITGLTAWTIGDSIFDFNDNSDADVVQSILREAGYNNFEMDNVAGTTIAAGSIGITERIAQGFYDDWQEPELILIQRGTNDCYYWKNQPEKFSAEKTHSAIEEVCKYFSDKFPDARIVWSTPIWRLDVGESLLNELRADLKEICPLYKIEVFELHKAENFAELDFSNYGTALVDGIHPTALGARYMKEAWINYLTAVK